MREGQTFPSTLGHRSSTVESALMRGETGGDHISGSKVPERFESDKSVEILNKVFWNLPEDIKNAISGVYLYRMQERRIALIIGISLHKVKKHLWIGYEAGFDALTNENKSH